jgi:hypothetical protein
MMIWPETSTFVVMFRILCLGILILLGLNVALYSQSNPFDLKFRTPRPVSATPAPSHKSIVDTPLVVTLEADDITVSPQDNPTIRDSGQSGADMLEGQIAPDTLNQNPFEIGSSKQEDLSVIAEPPKLIPKKDDPVENGSRPAAKRASKGFQIFFVLLSLLFLIFIVNVERSFVRDLWRVISNENYSSLHHRNQRNSMRQILLVMGYAVFIFQAGLFLYYVLQFYQYKAILLNSIWATIALVLGIYLTRHLVIRYLRWLFNNEKEMTLFGFDISIFNTMVGLVLLPINILLIFGPESIYKSLIIIGIITIVAAYMLRQLRWLLTARHLIVHSLFLFFVYLCAVEILPLWAISKLFW